MENYVSAQLQQLGAAVALGAAGGLVYDVLRAARLLDRRDRLLTHLLDALFVALLGAGILWLALVVGDGELRLYMVTGMALGAVLWFYLFSRPLRPVWDFWAAALVALCRLLGMPFVFLWRTAKKLIETVKKGFSFLRKCVKIRVEAWRKGRAVAHALYLRQLLRRSTQHVLQRAEFLQQPVGDLVGVPPGNGIIQRQLQHLVIGEAVQPMLAELFLLPRPVSVVQAHITPSLLL